MLGDLGLNSLLLNAADATSRVRVEFDSRCQGVDLDRHLRGKVDTAQAFRDFEIRESVVDPDYLLQRPLALELQRRWPRRVQPRYAMVMFTTMRYGEARRRAGKLAAVLEELTAGISHLGELDFTRAAELVAGLEALPALEEDRR